MQTGPRDMRIEARNTQHATRNGCSATGHYSVQHVILQRDRVAPEQRGRLIAALPRTGEYYSLSTAPHW
jgi:hypothetical protein